MLIVLYLLYSYWEVMESNANIYDPRTMMVPDGLQTPNFHSWLMKAFLENAFAVVHKSYNFTSDNLIQCVDEFSLHFPFFPVDSGTEYLTSSNSGSLILW